MADPEVSAVVAQGIAGLVELSARTLRGVGVRALNRLFRDTADALTAGAKELHLDDDAYLQDMWDRIGRNAQRSMQSAYGQLVTRKEGPASASHYRSGQGRLSDGVLRRAIGRKDFYTATADGLDFGNIAMLDSQAKHWHRINFGAAGRGEGSTAEFSINFAGAVSTSLGFDEGPSPAFTLPKGVWLSPESGTRVGAGANARGADMFYPQTMPVRDSSGNTVARVNVRPKGILGAAGKVRASAGIEAANFMDAGLARIARDIPAAFDQFLEDHLGRWKDGTVFKGGKRDIVQYRTEKSMITIEA